MSGLKGSQTVLARLPDETEVTYSESQGTSHLVQATLRNSSSVYVR
jgi:hypothetical protein